MRLEWKCNKQKEESSLQRRGGLRGLPFLLLNPKVLIRNFLYLCSRLYNRPYLCSCRHDSGKPCSHASFHRARHVRVQNGEETFFLGAHWSHKAKRHFCVRPCSLSEQLQLDFSVCFSVWKNSANNLSCFFFLLSAVSFLPSEWRPWLLLRRLPDDLSRCFLLERGVMWRNIVVRAPPKVSLRVSERIVCPCVVLFVSPFQV